MAKNPAIVPVWEKITAFSFGAVLACALLVTAFLIPEPSPTQYVTLKTLLAISAAGVGAVTPGILGLSLPLARKALLRATGAAVFFALVFFFSPSPPVTPSPSVNVTPPTVNQSVGPQGEGIQVFGDGNTVVRD